MLKFYLFSLERNFESFLTQSLKSTFNQDPRYAICVFVCLHWLIAKITIILVYRVTAVPSLYFFHVFCGAHESFARIGIPLNGIGSLLIHQIMKGKEAWCTAIHGVTKSQTQLSDRTTSTTYMLSFLKQKAGHVALSTNMSMAQTPVSSQYLLLINIFAS